MRNTFVVALCVLTLIAVMVDVLAFHVRTVHADSVAVHIRPAQGTPGNQTVLLYGERAIGFSCAGTPAVCFVATQ